MFVRMKSLGAALLFMSLLIIYCETSSPSKPKKQPSRQKIKPTTPAPTTQVTSPVPITTEAPKEDEFLGSSECLAKKFTHKSCGLVFCRPWERCIDGRCECKPPYMCPTENVTAVCGRDHKTYRSYCQLMALSCRTKKPVMSHFGDNCKDRNPFSSSIDPDTGVIKIFIPDAKSSEGGKELLVCEDWDMAAANVACKEHGNPLGAAKAGYVQDDSLTTNRDKNFPSTCVSIHCQGYETSLAECVIFGEKNISSGKVAKVSCYNAPTDNECGFQCVNSKCVSLNQTCDGVDDCGDRSDEMCCKKCRNKGFHCKMGVCVHNSAVRDGVVDCLDGEDESSKHSSMDKNSETHSLDGHNPHPHSRKPDESATKQRPQNTEYTSPKQEIKTNRKFLESKLQCGIPNKDAIPVQDRGRTIRVKRVVGGLPAEPTQIQWQVALEEHKKIDCGGAYIGGCWVLTAAHCVRPNPSAFMVKFSLWKKFRAQNTTDIVPVEEIRIHPRYNASTYENDIALVKLEKLPYTDICFKDNPAIRAVCVPWSTHLFQPGHTCSISGWGRNKEGKAAQVLLWANVSLIDNCQQFYNDRFKPGMMCAGDLEGSVDSCQGDSGGPLVCEDEVGVSYLWGIVSWGERCGQPGFPGVYTQVAHYFEWIRLHTGWPAVTKFNL
uniref:trypsin n=1 Tax=Mastacembelus armatus TaxID=205130 RepID=A0A3Q3RZM5_9TELE